MYFRGNLVVCPECGKGVSGTARRCLGCGFDFRMASGLRGGVAFDWATRMERAIKAVERRKERRVAVKQKIGRIIVKPNPIVQKGFLGIERRREHRCDVEEQQFRIIEATEDGLKSVRLCCQEEVFLRWEALGEQYFWGEDVPPPDWMR